MVTKLQIQNLNAFFVWLGVAAGIMISGGLLLGYVLQPTTVASCGAGGDNLGEISIMCFGSNVGVLLVKFVTFLLLMLPAEWLVRIMMGMASRQELREQQTTPDNVDSPVWLMALVAMAIAIFVSKLGFTNFFNYLDFMITKAGMLILLSMAIGYLLLRMQTTVSSLQKMIEQMRIAGTDAVAIWIGISTVIAALLLW